MRADVLKTVASATDVSNAIILTHNIDFVFVQTVVLAAFRRCGHPTITIFADAACAAESFAHQAPVLAGLGVRYRVVPIAMDAGFRFHPKAVFLSGSTAATLLVGSGNLTFGGWRENAEVWLRFDTECDGAAPFLAFRRCLADVLGRVALPDAVAAEVDEAFAPKSKTWISTEPTAAFGLVERVGSGAPLLDRMLEYVGGAPVEELTVCAPYFDDDGVALRGLITRVRAARTTVLCQPGRSTLTQRAWGPSSADAFLQRVDFTRTAASGAERSVFLHAKFYAFRRQNDVVVLAGSANCSRAALTAAGRVGNAELLAVRVVTAREFDEEYLRELKVTSEPLELPKDQPVQPEDIALTEARVRILAARFEARHLLVAYAPRDAVVVECSVDAKAAPFTSVERGVLRASCSGEPRLVAIRAEVDGGVIESVPAWIDHEHHLRATARGRSLADTIRARLQPGDWNAAGWADVLDVFCKHLSYMPVTRTGFSSSRRTADEDHGGAVEFTAADVFSTNYRRPSLSSIIIPVEAGGSGRVQSLQQLLLRWFGIASDDPDEGCPPAYNGEREDGEDGEVVDRPEALQVPTVSHRPATEVTERDRRRIDALLRQLEDAMTSTDFLAERGPDYLAADFKVASVLLRLGLRERWVEPKTFFDLTQRIWSSLFFSFASGKDVGWLEHRARSSEDMNAFINDMRSPELTAALIGWKLAAPSDDATPEAASLALAAVLAVARLPWLWHGGEPERIAEELAILLAHTAPPGMSGEKLASQAEAEWDLLLRRGQALRLLEAAVRCMTPADISGQISSDELFPGDLLWQGSAGFCVVCDRASRAVDSKVSVLKLQGDGAKAQFKTSLTIPMLDLLREDVVPPSHEFGDIPRRVLREFVDELGKGLAP